MNFTATNLAIALLAILFLPFSSAISFNFTAPSSISIDESFSVKISASLSENYDVKIVVEDSLGKTISQIYETSWRNPYQYIKSAFPASSEFQVRAINYSSSAQICVKLRKTNSTQYTENCNPITINPIQSVNPNLAAVSEEDSKTQESPAEENLSRPSPLAINPSSDFIPSAETFQEPAKENLSEEAIVLNKPKQKEFETSSQKLRDSLVYLFALLCIFIIVYLALKKL